MHRADTFDQKTLVKNLKIKMICMHFVLITYSFRPKKFGKPYNYKPYNYIDKQMVLKTEIKCVRCVMRRA